MSLSHDPRVRQVAREVSRELRKKPTRAEQILWSGLRAKRFRTKKFLRQHPIFVDANGRESFYVADFYCHEHRLVIELDGGIHDRQKDRDKLRTSVINQHGLEVIRFKSEEVEGNLVNVLSQLAEKMGLAKILNSPPAPPLRREGRGGRESDGLTPSPFLRERSGESSEKREAVWSELAQIMDPEIPVLSLVAMKIIREVRVDENSVTILMAPTFVGCPALDHMKNEVRERLTAAGFGRVNIEMTFSPPWSTDMLEEETKEKLRAYGIAPPPAHDVELVATLSLPVKCPQCGSIDTKVKSLFGATPCKQMFVCRNCKQPFERFKPV